MRTQTLGRYSPRAIGYAGSAQFAFGATQCLVGLLLWPTPEPTVRRVLAVAFAVCLLGALVHGTLATRLPLWLHFIGGLAGAGILLGMAAATWGDRLSSLLTAQLVLVSLTVAVFFSRRQVVGFVVAALVGWGVVCGLEEPVGGAVASWLTVGPTMVVTAVMAQWLVGWLLALVERDALTQVANRASWDRRLTELGDRPAAIVVLDLDHFKRINDRGGHAAGDALLRAVATAWAPLLRPRDLLARIGGDEFGLLLPDASLAEALAVAERLRACVACVARGAGVTAGAAQRLAGEPVDSLVRRADAALYRGKAEGRGRVVGDGGARLVPAG